MGALQYPQLVLGIAAIFLYVGAEVSIGSIMTGFVGLPETAGLSKADATVFVSLYWGGLMIGRFTGAVSMSRLARGPKRLLVVIVPFAVFAVVLSVFRLHGTDTGPLLYFLPFVALNAAGFLAGRAVAARTLSLFAVLAAALLVAGMAAHGLTAVFAVVAIGLFNSIMWSNIFTLAIRGLGKHTSQGASLLVMAILGGALVPPLQGLVADYHGIRLSFAVPLACYAYLAYYGFRARRYAGD
jgi:FHS family L-fucose permease-like MFS transporter